MVGEMNKHWPSFKDYFVEAYALRLDSGSRADVAGHHGAAAVVDVSDNDSMGSIIGSISQMRVAANANAPFLLDGTSTVSNNTNELRAALVTTQQQLAVLVQAVNQPYQMPAWNPGAMTQPQYNAKAAAIPPPVVAPPSSHQPGPATQYGGYPQKE